MAEHTWAVAAATRAVFAAVAAGAVTVGAATCKATVAVATAVTGSITILPLSLRYHTIGYYYL